MAQLRERRACRCWAFGPTVVCVSVRAQNQLIGPGLAGFFRAIRTFPSKSGEGLLTSRIHWPCVLASVLLLLFLAARFATPKNRSRSARSNERKQQHAISAPSILYIRPYRMIRWQRRANIFQLRQSVVTHTHTLRRRCSPYVRRLCACACARGPRKYGGAKSGRGKTTTYGCSFLWGIYK